MAAEISQTILQAAQVAMSGIIQGRRLAQDREQFEFQKAQAEQLLKTRAEHQQLEMEIEKKRLEITKINAQTAELKAKTAESEFKGGGTLEQIRGLNLEQERDELLQRQVARRPGAKFGYLDSNAKLTTALSGAKERVARLAGQVLPNSPLLLQAQAEAEEYQREAVERANLLRVESPSSPANELDTIAGGVGQAVSDPIKQAYQDADVVGSPDKLTPETLDKLLDMASTKPEEYFQKYMSAYARRMFGAEGGPQLHDLLIQRANARNR